MRHILFEIPTPWFTIPIMGYGLMIVLGFVSGIGLACRRARRCGENVDHVMNVGLLSLIGGIAGARLLYVLNHLDSFSGGGFWGNLLAVANVRAGGLVYYGGLIGATVLGLIYLAVKRLSIRRMLDIVAPALMLGLAFGRAGCLLNGCCWGGRLDLADRSETARGLLTLTFPFASPPFEQQARTLPWKVVDADGELFGYCVPRRIEDIDGRFFDVHVGWTSERPPAGPHLTVPVQFLRPALAPDESSAWRIVDRQGQVVSYYIPTRLPMPDGQQATYHTLVGPASAPDRPAVTVPQDQVLPTPKGPVVFYTHTPREALRTAEEQRLACRFRSLPVIAAQPIGIVNALLLCLVLTVFFPRRKRDGQVFALMLTLYPISRLLEEAIRKDTPPLAMGLTLSQNISIYILLAGVLMWLLLRLLPAVSPVPLSGVPVAGQEDPGDASADRSAKNA